MIALKPENLIVPLMNVWQSVIPNLSMNTVLSLLGYDSSFIETEKSSYCSVNLRGAATTFLPFFMKVEMFLEALIAAPGFQLNL